MAVSDGSVRCRLHSGFEVMGRVGYDTQFMERYDSRAPEVGFEDPDYDDRDWEQVTLPHTFNGGDLFSVPIEDGGSGQKRTCAFYRNTLEIPAAQSGKRVLLTFEGVRQTCCVYVNGRLTGIHENGVGPFGFDITPYLEPSGKNRIAVATDNTSTRNIPFCIAETPNAPGAEPGTFLQSQEEQVPPEQEGVGFQWNCNDFNPSIGGLSQPVRIHFKDGLHLTLPLYADLALSDVDRICDILLGGNRTAPF